MNKKLNQQAFLQALQGNVIQPRIKEQTYRYITIPLDAAIENDISIYRDCIEEIKDANEGDVVEIIINTDGGSLQTALAIITAIEESEAEVIANIEGMAASAGSLIALHCHGFKINPYSTMFIHAESFGSIGKRHEVKTQVEFNLKWVEKIIRDTYKYFLTEEEIELVLEGRDMYFDADEIQERLTRKIEILEAEQEDTEEDESNEHCEDCPGESCNSYESCTASIDASQFPEVKKKYSVVDSD